MSSMSKHRISIEDHAFFIKFVGGLDESILKELKLLKVEDISKARMKAMEI